MCGLGGYVGAGSQDALSHMNTLLSHRGPDAQGTWVGNGVGLAHTRLSLLDLSAAGSQPMRDQVSGVSLVFNGEIYNFRELKAELKTNGAAFRSRSDTEVLLKGYVRWGMDVIQRLRGMFAFAIWDERCQRLNLVRDRLGIKPLFYAPLGKGLVFASEMKALGAHPDLSLELNETAVDMYFALGYIPPPHTIYRGVYALAPGHSLQWEEGKIQINEYWKPDFQHSVLDNNEDDLTDELDARLNDAVHSHLVADVPVGAFLSGGVDSSLVAAIAQRQSAQRLKTFTIGFTGGGDERSFAREVSEHIGSEHQEGMAEPSLEVKLPGIVWHMDQPLFDNSVLPTYQVSEMARQEVKVVLSGDGGDEPFAGYSWTQWAVNLPNLSLPAQDQEWGWVYRNDTVGKLRRLYYDLSHQANDRYLRRITTDCAFRHWLYTPEYQEHLTEDPVEHLRRKLQCMPVRDPREGFLLADLTGYLPDDVLFKVDRMSMAHGLEVRVPLLDHSLVEWISRLPWNMRFRGGRGKYLLRRVAARYLPPHVLRRRKQGFTVPIRRWLHGDLGLLVKRLFTSREFAQRGIVLPSRALQLLEMHRSGKYDFSHRIWSIVIFETWCRVWLDGQTQAQSLHEMIRESDAAA